MKKEIFLAVVASFLLLTSCSEKKRETKPKHKDITEVVFATGMLEADDRYNLTAQTDGYLTDMNFKEGELVSKNQLMAIIDNQQNVINAQSASQLHKIAQENMRPSAPALLEIEAQIAAAAAKVQYDQQQLERHSRLLGKNSIASLEYDNSVLTYSNSLTSLKALQEQFEKQRIIANQQEIIQRHASKVTSALSQQNLIRAIRGGRVYGKQKEPGDYVRKGDVIANIGNPNVIYARLNIEEADIATVKVGQPVAIKLNTNPEKVYNATVRQILPAFDQLSRTFIVKAYFNEKPDADIVGTQLEANILTGKRKNALVIPSVYLNEANQIMLKEDNKVVTVKPGIISGEWVEILGGLDEGQTIVLMQPQ